jgi:hypothetical protein
MKWLRHRFDVFANHLIMRALSQPPDFIIGGHKDPYLLRWYLVPWRKWHRQAREAPTLWRRVKGYIGFVLPSVYLHCFLRSDDDRALHDHPWFWCSILLRGRYIEHTIAAGGIHRRRARYAPSVKVSGPWRAHRVQLFSALDAYCDTHDPRWLKENAQPAWTLFITGLRMREWGFHCAERGWVSWRKFTAADDPGSIGRGCGEG